MALIATIRHRAAICGYVVDALTGAGIGGALVEIADPALTTTSRADGFYGFLDLADGGYELHASAPALGSRYGSATVSGIVVASGAQGQPVLDPDGRLALPPTQLAGTVRRADTAAPIARAQVRLRASAVAVLADAAGGYRLAGVEAGTQTAVVTAAGFVAHTEQVVLTAGEEMLIDFNLTAG
jgi:hypothetical protein